MTPEVEHYPVVPGVLQVINPVDNRNSIKCLRLCVYTDKYIDILKLSIILLRSMTMNEHYFSSYV